MKSLKIMFWAALHHPQFWTCRIPLPFHWNVYKWKNPGKSITFQFEFQFFKPYIHIPWVVQRDYEIAHGLASEYDDIPF